MICLGIESTAHTFGVGIADEKRILSNVRSVYQPPEGSGIHPRRAAEHHLDTAVGTLKKSLEQSKLTLRDIDMIAVSQGPGMPPCLQIGLTIAKALSVKTKKNYYGINHCIAHIEIGRLACNSGDPIVVYVSGGNTQILGYASGRYRVFGETLDIAIGNARDSLARHLGYSHPGGPVIDQLAKTGSYVQLPYVVKGMDLSFSGIVTAAVKLHGKGLSKKDVCYSFQETTFAMLTEVTERALAHTGKNEVLLTGGVAASPRCKEMMKIMCRERGARCFSVLPEYSGDNGAMIAYTAILARKQGIRPLILQAQIRQNWRTDDVDWKML